MPEELSSVLKNWGLGHIMPVRATEAGAALATGVWYLNDQYSLKTGSDVEGLRHHIHISRVLRRNGITASCPLPTLNGEDFIHSGDGYYVITERVTDNFLSTRLTPPDRDAFYFERYAREIRHMDQALSRGGAELLAVLDWARGRARAFAGARGMEFPSLVPSGSRTLSRPEEIVEGHMCATKFRTSTAGLFHALEAEGREEVLLHVLALFLAWTGGQQRFDELIHGNLAAAHAVSRALSPSPMNLRH